MIRYLLDIIQSMMNIMIEIESIFCDKKLIENCLEIEKQFSEAQLRRTQNYHHVNSIIINLSFHRQKNAEMEVH